MGTSSALSATAATTIPAIRQHGRSVLLAGCAVVFALPALVALSRGAWRSEAGSLAPIVIALGGWTLWQAFREHREVAAPGSPVVWAPILGSAIILSAFAAAIAMASLQTLAVWLGCVAAFYAVFGKAMVRACAFPLLFLGLTIPLPFSLSMPLNAALRAWVADRAVGWGSSIGLDAALEQGNVIVGQYVLGIENACAGASSTLSLIAIGLLYAFWVMRGGWVPMVIVALASVPIAMAANVARVVALMAMVAASGTGVLDTWLHPVSGLISFSIALALLVIVSKLALLTAPRIAV